MPILTGTTRSLGLITSVQRFKFDKALLKFANSPTTVHFEVAHLGLNYKRLF